ncbi:MAG: hypothetical protein RLZZ584_509 [Pseudomonadota bacterium]
MTISRRLLALIGQRIPSAWDAIHPHGPVQIGALQERLAAVALSPQPLPPGSALETGAAVAAEFVRLVWQADRTGASRANMSEVLDDWCPTVPRRIKFPPWWPPIPPEPDPHPDWLAEFHLGFAARLAVAVRDVAGKEFDDTLNKAIDRSVAVIR